MLKEYKLSLDTFIGGWFIPKKVCNDLIKYFEKNKKIQVKGKYGVKDTFYVDKKYKDSLDININDDVVDNEIVIYKKYLQKVLNLYQKRYKTVKDLAKFNLEGFNIQKYPKKGGYKIWHNERRSPFTAR